MPWELGELLCSFSGIGHEQYCAPVMFELFCLVLLLESVEESIDSSNLSVRGDLPLNLTRQGTGWPMS